MIDSSKGISNVDEAILNKLNFKDVPYVLFANKQDISYDAIEHHTIKPETPIIPTVATSGHGVGEGLLTTDKND